MNGVVSGQKKEVETLTETIGSMTKEMKSKETQMSSLNSSVGELKDSLEVGEALALNGRWRERRTRKSAPSTCLCNSSWLRRRR